MCEHENFDVAATINRMSEVDNGPIKRYQADIRIVCAECKLPFRFVGLPIGLDLTGAAVSVDGEEGRFAILPRGEVITPLDGVGGFTVKRTTNGR